MNWVSTSAALPDENVVVNTLSDGGVEQELKRIKSLWFYPDGSMYVYYTPIMWKPI